MKKILPFLLLTAVFLVSPSKAWAEITPEQQQQYNDLNKRILELQGQLAGYQSQDRSLKNELASLDSKMALTQARIGQAQVQLAAKEQELRAIGVSITDLQTRITRLAEAVDRQTTAFDARLQEQYKRDLSMPIIQLFLSADSFSDIASELKYLNLAQTHDQMLITQMKNTKQSYKDQTDLLEIKKEEATKVKAQIEEQQRTLSAYQAELVDQSNTKKQLLIDTQNNEAKYQQLISQAKAELDAITGAFAGADFTNAKEVKAGDVIAVMGNSGYPSCSTGAHLHFEVRKNGVLANAEDYLENKTLPYDDDPGRSTISIGGGHWPWPMQSPRVEQHFGHTRHAYWYAGGVHTGVDMVSNESYLIYAPADGQMIKKTGTCGSSTYNYVLIKHSDGVESLYLHVQ
jgi:septal ring factor EnvC (AmiA/AmiB activator)